MPKIYQAYRGHRSGIFKFQNLMKCIIKQPDQVQLEQLQHLQYQSVQMQDRVLEHVSAFIIMFQITFRKILEDPIACFYRIKLLLSSLFSDFLQQRRIHNIRLVVMKSLFIPKSRINMFDSTPNGISSNYFHNLCLNSCYSQL